MPKRADGQVDMTKVISAFCDYANAPKYYKFDYRQAETTTIFGDDCI